MRFSILLVFLLSFHMIIGQNKDSLKEDPLFGPCDTCWADWGMSKEEVKQRFDKSGIKPSYEDDTKLYYSSLELAARSAKVMLVFEKEKDSLKTVDIMIVDEANSTLEMTIDYTEIRKYLSSYYGKSLLDHWSFVEEESVQQYEENPKLIVSDVISGDVNRTSAWNSASSAIVLKLDNDAPLEKFIGQDYGYVFRLQFTADILEKQSGKTYRQDTSWDEAHIFVPDPENDCSKFKDIKYKSSKYPNLEYLRKGNLQITKYLDTGSERHQEVEWLSDCEYAVTITKMFNADGELVTLYNDPGLRRVVRILQPRENGYTAYIKTKNGFFITEHIIIESGQD